MGLDGPTGPDTPGGRTRTGPACHERHVQFPGWGLPGRLLVAMGMSRQEWRAPAAVLASLRVADHTLKAAGSASMPMYSCPICWMEGLVRNPDSRYLDAPRRPTSQLGSQLQTNDKDVFVGLVLAIEF